jgi:hypothetical protein
MRNEAIERALMANDASLLAEFANPSRNSAKAAERELAELVVNVQHDPPVMAIPAMVYCGLAGRFVDALEKSTESPREFRLAAFLTVAGALVGRQTWVTYSRPTFPNLFTLLIGETAFARKTTVMSFAFDLMAYVVENTQIKVKPLYGLASVEGLAMAMKDGDSPDPYRVVIVEDELKSLLQKAQQKSVGNLIPRLTELYNCGRSFEVKIASMPRFASPKESNRDSGNSASPNKPMNVPRPEDAQDNHPVEKRLASRYA